jgi:glutaconyl-CoA/methylmalonyl-CoA decarboxylase subunit gamma
VRIALRHRHRLLDVQVHREGDRYQVSVDGDDHAVTVEDFGAGTIGLVIDGRRYRAELAHLGRERLVAVGGEAYTFAADSPAATHAVATAAAPEITAPMPGKVLQVLVQPGQHTDSGDGLLILEAMKMENRLVAEAPGTVVELRVTAGDLVDGGQVLIVMRYDAGTS